MVFTGGGYVKFKPRPSSALQVGSTLANSWAYAREAGPAPSGLDMYGAGGAFATPTMDPMSAVYANDSIRRVGSTVGQDYGYASPRVPGRPGGTPNPTLGAGAPDDWLSQSSQDAADLWASQFMPDPAQMAEQEYLGKLKELQDKEFELREAMLNGDLARARELLADIEANRAALQVSYQKYLNTVSPHFDNQIKAAGAAGAVAQTELKETGEQSAAEQQAIAEGATATSDAFGDLIGNSAAGKEAAAGMAAAGLAEFADLISGRHQGFMSIAAAQQEATEKRALGERAFMQSELANREKVAMAGFDQRADEVADQIADLEMQRKLFDIQRSQADLQHQRALQELTGSVVDMDALGYGRMQAELYLDARAAAMGIAPDRLQAIKSMWEEAYSQGVFSSSEFKKWFTGADADGNLVSADAGWVTGLSTAEQALLSQAFDAYMTGRTDWVNGNVKPSFNPVTGGSTSGKSGGEAPNNMQIGATAKNPSSGAYYSRQKYAAQMMSYAVKTFGVRSGGQWRDTSVVATGARSSNSDHYSGGAIDLKGTPSQMAAAAAYFRNHPAVSFVLYGGAGHHDHVHVSFNIGYFGG